MWEARIRPAGAMRMSDSTRLGKYDANDAAIPPPSEYPIMENRFWLPVQGIGEEERTRWIWVVKSWKSWGWEIGSGVEEKPRPKRSDGVGKVSRCAFV